MSVTNFFKGVGELYSKEMELAAIWLDHPVQTATERTPRLTEGHLVTIKEGRIVDCVDKKPTHKIIGCFGTVTSSSLTFLLCDLKTNQPVQLKIK